MIVDLHDLRPKNETFEHYILKIIGKAILFEKGLKCIGTEIEVVGKDITDFGSPKRVIDVLGIYPKEKTDAKIIAMVSELTDIALEYGETIGIVQTHKYGGKSFISPYSMKTKKEKALLEVKKKECYQKAGEQKYKNPQMWELLQNQSKTHYNMTGIEVKVSRADYFNGFSLTPDILYVFTPKDLISPSELPPNVGLIEFDFDKYYSGVKWINCVETKIKAKKSIDTLFLCEDKKTVKDEEYRLFCEKAYREISKSNTIDTIYWNPWFKYFNENIVDDAKKQKFKHKIGERTSSGIIIQRQIKIMPNFKKIPVYKCVVEDVGLTKWIEEGNINSN